MKTDISEAIIKEFKRYTGHTLPNYVAEDVNGMFSDCSLSIYIQNPSSLETYDREFAFDMIVKTYVTGFDEFPSNMDSPTHKMEFYVALEKTFGPVNATDFNDVYYDNLQEELKRKQENNNE